MAVVVGVVVVVESRTARCPPQVAAGMLLSEPESGHANARCLENSGNPGQLLEYHEFAKLRRRHVVKVGIRVVGHLSAQLHL